MENLLSRLSHYQQRLVDTLLLSDDDKYNQQYHPDLSPLGWHAGHCAYTESYWIREAWLRREILDEQLKTLYIPELCVKQERGEKLPQRDQLLEWIIRLQAENLEFIEAGLNQGKEHALLKDDFLFYFLMQHYAQHMETIAMIQQCMAVDKNDAYEPDAKLKAQTFNAIGFQIDKNDYLIGSSSPDCFYDNEKPLQQVSIESCQITTRPVNNAEFLNFMLHGGYDNNKYWSEKGWQWREQSGITHPFHWRQNTDGEWFEVSIDGPRDLAPEASVYGVSHYEAEAFARFVNMRLPHEYEWEIASKYFDLPGTGEVWEWCENSFHSYVSFKAFPYTAYSSPYFDGEHFVLRGGSSYTDELIKRPSFRNYYQADKRHIFSGFRLIT